MLFMPFRKIEIRSPLLPDQVIERIAPHVSRRRPWFRSLHGKAGFTGEISRIRIRLQPVIRGHNSYLPLMTGRITSREEGSILEITQSIHPVSALIFVCFVAMPLFMGYGIDESAVSTWAIFMAGFHIFMCNWGFLPDAMRAEERLRALSR